MKLTTREITVFAMLGAIMYVSKIIMDLAPNIHLLGMFIVAYTIVYRAKALYPIYVFVFITGLFGGFATWWIPYLYIWTILWAAVMLLPKNIPPKIRPLVYMIVSACHGFLYGIMYAPTQAIVFGYNLEKTVAWIMTGLPWDITHGISNFVCGMMILPVVRILRLAEQGKINN